MNIRIRKMQASDAARVAGMNFLLSGFKKKPSLKEISFFRKSCLGAKKMALAWVGCVGSKPQAFAIARDWVSFGGQYKVRQIDLLFVEEKFRGQGIARALIDAVIADARTSGCVRVDVEADKDNKGANRLYKNLEFMPRKNVSTRYRLML